MVFGTVVVLAALKGYTRRKSISMLLMGIGFAFVTIGAVTAGVLFDWMSAGFIFVGAVQALSQAVGFFFTVYSLLGHQKLGCPLVLRVENRSPVLLVDSKK